MNNDKRLQLAATLQKAIDELNAMAPPKPAPYEPKKGDRVEVIGEAGINGTTRYVGQRGHIDKWETQHSANAWSVQELDAWFDAKNIRPLTPEEIAEEEQAKRPKVGDWVRHADGSTGQVKYVYNNAIMCTVKAMGEVILDIRIDALTVIPKP